MIPFSLFINSIEIQNLKNVFNGQICISKKPEVDCLTNSDIIGIYGQNGSGKTTVIQALDLLKKLASNMPVWSDMAECISAGKDNCRLSYSFYLVTESDKFKINYTFVIKRNEDKTVSFSEETLTVLKLNENNRRARSTTAFKCNFNDPIQVIEPKSRYNSITKNSKENTVNLSVAYKLAQERNSSFLFSDELFKILEKSNEKDLFKIVSCIKKYAAERLFVIQNSHNGIISLDVMPLAILHSENDRKVIGEIPITLQEPMITDLTTFNIVSSVIENMNVVIGALVPGMSIGIKDYGKQLLKEGFEGIRYELISRRYDSEFPIRYESEGIKKLLSLLSIVIAMYNNPSVCIAIDELDAGIFEALLGTLLHTLKETGKGQLIFTSHNLRPLEVLDKENIIFTTTNPNNRYMKLRNVRDKNNLRDLYIRAINLGGQEEELSTEFKESGIRRALRQAGKNGN